MAMNRRSFLQNAGALSTLAYLGVGPEVSLAQTAASTKLSILQGRTDASSAELSVMVATKNYSYRLRDPKLGIEIAPTKKWNVNWPEVSAWSLDKMLFTRLDVGTAYILEVRDSRGKLVDNRILKTLDLERRDVHIAWMSCMHDKYAEEQKRIWLAAKTQKPEMIFFIGDSVYCDTLMQMAFKIGAKPPQIWTRFVETRFNLDFYKFDQLIPVIAVWDDHDYGKNNAGAEYEHKKDSLNIFQTFFAQTQTSASFRKGPGCSSVFEGFGQKYILVDNRTFKTSSCYWGNNLRDWVFAELESATTPVCIMEGQQFFGGYCDKGSFEFNHRARFKTITNEMKNIRTPITFASGDLHYSEINKLDKDILGYETFEFTSSSMHSYTKDPRPNNPRRVMASGQRNFIGTRTGFSASGLDIKTYVRGEQGILWERDETLIF